MLRVGTRKSPLARWQTAHVLRGLRRAHPGLRLRAVPISTQGDRGDWMPAPGTDLKASFTHEIEAALLAKQIDIAVHSVKDMAHTLEEGLTLGAVCERGDARDALVSRTPGDFDALPPGAVLGTGSLRRRSQLRHRRADLRCAPMRGNVQTRLAKLERGDCDALVLAAAGLRRLGLAARVDYYLPVDLCLPAAGQAAIGVEARADDAPTLEILAAIRHQASARQVRAERACIRALSGGCHTAIAAFATSDGERLTLRARVGAEDGTRMLEATAHGADPESLGAQIAEDLLAQGAGALLE